MLVCVFVGVFVVVAAAVGCGGWVVRVSCCLCVW